MLSDKSHFCRFCLSPKLLWSHKWFLTKQYFKDRMDFVETKFTLDISATFHQLLAVGRWFPPGAPVSSTRKLISSSFHRLDMTLAVAEALNP